MKSKSASVIFSTTTSSLWDWKCISGTVSSCLARSTFFRVLLRLSENRRKAYQSRYLIFVLQLKKEDFRSFNLLEIDDDENYAANCVWINGTVLIPTGYPKARATIESAGYSIREIEVSEFRKLDGGLSCLSLRF